jgi:hypothetical protein
MANDGAGMAIVRGNGAALDAGVTRRDGVEGTALARSAETASTAQAEMAKADVLARFQMARLEPRDMDVTRQVLLRECKRPGFADAAMYAKPVGGGKIEGLSVRFAESAARAMGNIDVATPTIFEDAEKRIIRVRATDLETNYTISADVTVQKTVERKKLKNGQQPIATRENSYGDLVYIVEATDDEVMQKAGALVSKARRNLILQLLPADIQEEARRAIKSTQHARDKADPDAARKAIADAFFEQGVGAADLKEYLGHDLGSCSPAELADLRAVYAGIRDGETTWREIMSKRDAGETAQSIAGSAPASRTGRVKAAAASAAARARGEEPPKHDPAAGEVDEDDLPPAPDAA